VARGSFAFQRRQASFDRPHDIDQLLQRVISGGSSPSSRIVCIERSARFNWLLGIGIPLMKSIKGKAAFLFR
jgi:hypothetical protein